MYFITILVILNPYLCIQSMFNYFLTIVLTFNLFVYDVGILK